MAGFEAYRWRDELAGQINLRQIGELTSPAVEDRLQHAHGILKL